MGGLRTACGLLIVRVGPMIRLMMSRKKGAWFTPLVKVLGTLLLGQLACVMLITAVPLIGGLAAWGWSVPIVLTTVYILFVALPLLVWWALPSLLPYRLVLVCVVASVACYALVPYQFGQYQEIVDRFLLGLEFRVRHSTEVEDLLLCMRRTSVYSTMSEGRCYRTYSWEEHAGAAELRKIFGRHPTRIIERPFGDSEWATVVCTGYEMTPKFGLICSDVDLSSTPGEFRRISEGAYVFFGSLSGLPASVFGSVGGGDVDSIGGMK